MTWLLANWRIIAAGGALVLAFAVGWTANGWRAAAVIAGSVATAEHQRAEAFRWVAAEQNRSAQAMADADNQALKVVNDAEQETTRLQQCIDTGTGCGLRVRVVRTSAQCGQMPEAGAAAGVGDRGGEWAELDPVARHGYYTLRKRLPEVEQALRLCVSQWPR